MRKSFVQAVSRRSLKTASHFEACEDLSSCASAKSALPAWVSKHEPLAPQKSKPEFAARQRHKSIGANPWVAPLSQSTKLLTVAEAAWLLSLSQKTIRRMISTGSLAVIRLGHSIRINPEVIEKIIRQDE